MRVVGIDTLECFWVFFAFWEVDLGGAGCGMVIPSRYWHHSWPRRWCGMSRLGRAPAVLRFGCRGKRGLRR